LETQCGIRKWPDYYTFSAKAKGRGFGENGHPNVLRYEVNRFLRCNDIVSAFRNDSLTPSCFHDCVVDNGVNSARKQNPVIFRQISERDLFFFGSGVTFRKNRIERCQDEW
jgi:hypothetical protein